MSILYIFGSAWLIGLSGAVMPGPLMTVTIRQTLTNGIRSVITIVFAHALLEALAVIGLILGLGRYMSLNSVSGTVAVCGGIVLSWMALSMIKDCISNKLTLNLTAIDGTVFDSAFMQGLLTTISNPYWLLWWATIGANFTGISQGYGTPGLIAFYFGHILADFSWLMLIGTMLVKGKKFLTDKIYRAIILLLSIFLAAAAVYFIISGVKFLLNIN
jgi:threonine/homoserine/homoserine lactone efflux protein